MNISKIGIGTWKMGGDVIAKQSNNDEQDIAALRYAFAHGINHVDTSESYAAGKSEELVGRAIEAFDRSSICIATKVREWNLRFNDLVSACSASLKRLGTSYIDLYYIHKQNPNIPISEICYALNFLLDHGLIREVGLSNVGIDTIKEYNKFLDRNVCAVQNQYNLICRESQRKNVIEFCQMNDIRFIAWRPIMLTYPQMEKSLCENGMCSCLEMFAEKYSVTKVQIAAKWLLQQENVHIIFKSSNPLHIQEIIDTQNFQLTPLDWEYLNSNFPIQFDLGCSINEFFEIS